jgi:hypothetical protein
LRTEGVNEMANVKTTVPAKPKIAGPKAAQSTEVKANTTAPKETFRRRPFIGDAGKRRQRARLAWLRGDATSGRQSPDVSVELVSQLFIANYFRAWVQRRTDNPIESTFILAASWECKVSGYLDFEIEAVEIGRGQWHARFHRIDRKPMFVDGSAMERVEVGFAWPGPEAALADARHCIDRMIARRGLSELVQ